MIGTYEQAISNSLGAFLDFCIRLAMPLAIVIGFVALAAGLSLLLQKEASWIHRADWVKLRSQLLGALAVTLIFIASWAGLRAVLPIAQEDLAWREAAEATTNPVPDAPAASQYGPTAASMVERTYNRTLTLPPDFLQRIGDQGIGVLSPYLTDPSAENVLRLADDFKRSGQNVVFTRSMTRLDEEPIPFSSSSVSVKFRRLAGQAYDADFEGKYLFANAGSEPIDARFLLPLPSAGAIRDLDVKVGEQAVREPNSVGSYEWKGKLAPGEQREAVIHYKVLGARSWQYDMGSARRRVQQFRLDIAPGGPIRYQRGSLQPTTVSDKNLRWDLSNVVTAQHVAIVLPPESEGRESYLQALSAMPASLVLFMAGALVVGFRIRRLPSSGRFAAAVGLFAVGLGSAVILANYIGPVAAILIGPIAGAFLAASASGPRSLAASIPAALVPAAFLSPQHSGLIGLMIAILFLGGLRAFTGSFAPRTSV